MLFFIMRSTLLPILFILLLVGQLSARGFEITPPRHSDEAIPGHVLVKVSRTIYASGVTPGSFGQATLRHGIFRVTPWLDRQLLAYRQTTLKSALGSYETPEQGLMRIQVLEYSGSAAPEDVAAALERIPGVEYAEPVYRKKLLGTQSFVPNDPDLSLLWHLAPIKAEEAWDLVRGDTSVTVAVVDDGIDREHSDLKSALWMNPGESGLDAHGQDKRTNGIDDDGDGFVDDFWGWDFSGADGYTPDNDPTNDTDPHGTHVAGIIGASGNNGIGVVGVAFGVKLMSVKIGDAESSPALFHEFNGIVYAVQKGARVINCSWGNRSYSRAEREVTDWALSRNTVIVSSAGNDNAETLFYPASYPGVLSVAAVDRGDVRADFSEYNGSIGISAPGRQIYSTYPADNYNYDSGTSMAAPIVSGAAALVAIKYPSLKGDQIVAVLRAGADNITGIVGADMAEYMGSGRLNIYNAIQTGPAVRSARMIDYTVQDGNGDGVILSGETVTVSVRVKNILADAPSVHVAMDGRAPADLSVGNAQFDLTSMVSGEVRTSPNGSLTFTVPPMGNDSVIVLRVAVGTADRTNIDFITLQVNPTYLTTDLNRIEATFNSVGNIGYNGTNLRQGIGFKYDTTHSQLYHGGLLIGTSSDRLSDAVRLTDQSADGTANGFEIVEPFRLVTAADSSVQTGAARFDDAHRAAAARVGVDVRMATYEYRASPLDNCLIVTYKVTNTSGATLQNLHCGLFLDWDVDVVETDNQASYDESHRLGYARNAIDPNSIFMGATLLTNQSVDFYAIDNYSLTDGITSFVPETKWRMLSSGIGRSTSNIGDISMMIGGGPITIEPNQSATFAFALMGAPTLEALRQSAEEARAKYNQIADVREIPSSPAASTVVLHPNPFADRSSVSFDLGRSGAVALRLYDLRGTLVGTAFDGTLGAGAHALTIDGSDLPDGSYLYELRTPEGLVHGRLLKLAK